MKKERKIGNTAKKCVMVLALMLIAMNFTFAGDVNTTQVDNTVNKIVDFFNGGWVKGILCIMLIGECLGLVFAGGQNPQIFKKFLPFIVGTVLLMCAGKIINVIWSGSSSFSKDLSGQSSFIQIQQDLQVTMYDIKEFLS